MGASGVRGDEPAATDAGAPISHSSIGVAAQVQQVVIAGPELEAKPIGDRKAPMIVRVVATFRHGSDFRYDLEYYGLERGRYDLRESLQRKDHSSMETVQPLLVEIESRLPAGQILPTNLSAAKLPTVGGYRTAMYVGVIVWVAGVVWLLRGRRRESIAAADIERISTPAERLRPLVVEALAGRLTPEGQAALERLLLNYWRDRLDLVDADPVQALAIVRAHPEAGALLRLMEDWLHRPGGASEADVAAVLAPYQYLPDGDDVIRAQSASDSSKSVGMPTTTTTQGT